MLTMTTLFVEQPLALPMSDKYKKEKEQNRGKMRNMRNERKKICDERTDNRRVK